VAGLKVVTSLDARNEFGKAAVEVVTRNVQIATGPGPAEIPTDIESRPIVWLLREQTGAAPLPPCPRRARGCSHQLQ
jgi:hypothetical protein